MKGPNVIKHGRISLLAFIMLFMPAVSTAPVAEFSIRMARYNAAREIVRKKHHEAEFDRFVRDLGYRESANNWLCINLIGCFGEWQFAEGTLHTLGFRQVTLKKFKKDPYIFPPELQRLALESLIRANLSLIGNYEDYVGDTIMGVVVTKSGIIAAAHLGGYRSVQKFLASRGKINKKDVLGTSVFNYMKRFRYYDLG
ncbi:MAG: hypothetical protein HPY62_06395 [Bacteroidales bacterium]|nr:hypothetical protein [Bacteroidales bacterium]